MTYYVTDYKEDVLAITDEQVAADWSMGLLRSVGKLVAESALPDSGRGRFGVTLPGTPRAHIRPPLGSKACSLTEIYDVWEEKGERWDGNTFDDNTNDVITVVAKASCACGELVRVPVTMDITPGEFIIAVTNTDR